MWSFVANKGNKKWVWLAMDTETRQIIAAYVGNRDEEAARCLWNRFPAIYREYGDCYTDFWSAYESIIPSDQHHAVGKQTGKTNYIERFNNTLRQRVSRLVRKALSFSKKLANHIGSIFYFIHHYNKSLHL